MFMVLYGLQKTLLDVLTNCVSGSMKVHILVEQGMEIQSKGWFGFKILPFYNSVQ